MLNTLCRSLRRSGRHCVKRAAARCVSRLLGGGYLLSHFRSTIGVVRLNFSVRNGKRWDPHAISALISSSATSLAVMGGDHRPGTRAPIGGGTVSSSTRRNRESRAAGASLRTLRRGALYVLARDRSRGKSSGD